MSDPRMTPGTGTADEAAGSKEKNVLSIRGLSKAFGRTRVLDRVDLDVREGSVLGLMGENGAGKSTMMKCLFGITQRDDGKIFLSGREVHFSTPREALENGIAMVHQELQPVARFRRTLSAPWTRPGWSRKPRSFSAS